MTLDEKWRSLLSKMEIPGAPKVYALGCFAKHVTFYSQQVRALNLVDALCNTGLLFQGSTVGIIGTGLAGITVAAAALKRGVNVELFEKEGDPSNNAGKMPLQIYSSERWVDPFIYDWPMGYDHTEAQVNVSIEPSANLPLLNWHAQSAQDIRSTIISSFDEIAINNQHLIHFHQQKIEQKDISRIDDSWQITTAKDIRKVDALIIAIGFGIEDDRYTSQRYWTNDGLASNQASNKNYLISGAGDGGLTDLMRVCINDFDHRKVLAAFKNSAEIGKILEDAINNSTLDLSKTLFDCAIAIDLAPAAEVKILAPANNKVFLTGTVEEVFGSKSKGSVLNRLIVAWLFYKQRFVLLNARVKFTSPSRRSIDRNPIPKLISPSSGKESGKLQIIFFQNGIPSAKKKYDVPAQFDRWIVRHGPGKVNDSTTNITRVSPFEENFPAFWKANKSNRDYWRTIAHWDDLTRKPLWTVEEYENPAPLEKDPKKKGTYYLVVEHTGNNGLVERAVKGATYGQPDTYIDRINVDKAFDSPNAFGRAIRALCQADVVIFDLLEGMYSDSLTSSEERDCPEAMILLGIRAAARRSVTLLTTQFIDSKLEPTEEDAPFKVATLPFLLQDILFYGRGKEKEFIARLKTGIGEGLRRKKSLGSIYRDLPAYDEVRKLGPNPEDYRPQGPSDVVLFLAPFDEAYRTAGAPGEWLRARVQTVVTGKAIYITETTSPERMSVKLYSAIRRTQCCIIDWTRKRPNVFFELGVRLAVTPTPPICVIHCDEKQKSGLFSLFKPLQYDPADNEKTAYFENALYERTLLVSSKSTDGSTSFSSEWPLNGATISPSFVYQEVRAAIPQSEQDWNVPVWKELRTGANLLLGPGRESFPDSPVLFTDDPTYKQQSAYAGHDRLLAAWYFLERRYNFIARLEEFIDSKLTNKNLSEHEAWTAWLTIGMRIKTELRNEDDLTEDYERMREEIERVLSLVGPKKPKNNIV